MTLNHTSYNRRKWIASTGIGLGSAWLQSFANAKSLSDALFGGASFRSPDDPVQRFCVVRVAPLEESGSQGPVLATSPFYPHGWAIDSDRPERAFFFEKQGPGAALFDLKSMQLLEILPTVKQRHFYGHGVLADKGTLLLSTESSPDGKGAIGIRDSKTHQYLGDFPSYGARPHDCHLIDGGRVLVVSNGGGPRNDDQNPNVSYIDVASQRLLHQHQMPGSDYNTGHLAPLANDNAVVTSAPRFGLGTDFLGAVSLCSTKSPTLQVFAGSADLTPGLFGEALSVVVVPEKDLIVVTHPTPGWLTMWSLRHKKLRASLRVERARGVALTKDRQSLWVSHGPAASIGRLSLDTLKWSEPIVLEKSMITGSHLLNWSVDI